jgi:hypothetical protein
MKHMWNRLTSILGAAALVVLAGCETEPVSTMQVQVTPETATVYDGQSIEFTASGGVEYTWSLSDETLGILSTRHGAKTVYTSVKDANATQALTVTSFIPGSGGTNAAANLTGQAFIYHRSGS